jgi:hypothetical protein
MRDPLISLDFLGDVDVTLGRDHTPEEYVILMRQRMRAAYELVHTNLNRNFERSKRRFDIRKHACQFHVGQQVWFYSPRKFRRLSPKWAAPFLQDEEWAIWSNPEVSTSNDFECQTEPVDVRAVPPVMYARACQTPAITVPPLRWPNDLPIRDVLDMCLRQRATGPDTLADELYRDHLTWSEETRLRAGCRARSHDGHETRSHARQKFIASWNPSSRDIQGEYALDVERPHWTGGSSSSTWKLIED